MPAPRPAHSCKLAHAVFVWSPSALITSLSRAWRSVSPIPTGRTPGLLFSTARRHAISARYSAQGEEELAIQSANLATTTLNSSGEHPKRRSQLCSSIASAPSTSAAPGSFDATHVTSSSVKSRGTVSGTSSCSSKAEHVEFSMGATRMSGCFSRRTSATGRPVFVHWSSRRRHPPPSLSVARRTAF